MSEAEVRELNRLTTILLDIFEDQTELGRLTLMSEAATLLDQQLTALGRVALQHGGSVPTTEAHRHAERVYEFFKQKRKQQRQIEADEAITALKSEARKLPKKRDPK